MLRDTPLGGTQALGRGHQFTLLKFLHVETEIFFVTFSPPTYTNVFH